MIGKIIQLVGRWQFARAIVILLSTSQVTIAAEADVESALDSLVTFQATFTQTVKEAHAFNEEVSSGQVWVQRPGKFNWQYDTGPQPMTIIADGINLWIEQPNLSQVIVQSLAAIEQDLPITWLSSNQPIAERYNTRRLEDKLDGLQWYDLQNKRGGTQEVAFIELGLAGNLLQEVLVTGSDGKQTRVKFQQAQRNTALDASLFQYTPGPKTDVIGEPQ